MSEARHARDEIKAFEDAYGYDASYLHALLDASPAAYRAFSSARGMTSFREELPADAHYVAAITVMQEEDCGTCLELNLKLALEAGVEKSLLQTLLDSPDDLPGELRDVRRHAQAVSRREGVDEDACRRIKTHYGEAAFVELALCIVGVRIYPSLKRALLKEGPCPVTSVKL